MCNLDNCYQPTKIKRFIPRFKIELQKFGVFDELTKYLEHCRVHRT